MYSKMRDVLVKIAKESGQEILRYYGKNAQIKTKEDESPLTLADLASEKVIIKGLKENFKDIPIISEETIKEEPGPQFFLVDPLDGTKEFLAENGQFVVSIGLIENNYPICGILYMPAFDIVYYAEKDKGTFKCENTKWEKLQVRSAGPALRLLASHHKSKSTDNLLKDLKPIGETLNVGSAYKFAFMAEGKADFYPRLDPLREWDTAAGQIILEGAGGKVIDLNQNRLRYGKEEFKHKGFICLGNNVFEN